MKKILNVLFSPKSFVALLFLFLLTPLSHGQIVITVDGGQSGGYITYNITTGGSFTSTASSSGATLIVFDELFAGTPNDVLTDSFSSSTVSLDGVTATGYTGTSSVLGLQTTDLLFGFATGISSGVSIDLSVGTRVTATAQVLNYDSINSVGNAWLIDGSGNVISNVLTYSTSAVPEPSAFALIAGCAILGLATTRRRRAVCRHQQPHRVG